jgi:hypothetical protein
MINEYISLRDQAIRNVHTNVIIIDGEFGSLDKDYNAVELDDDAVATEISRLETLFDSELYARNRATEYPSQGDQNDMIYKDMLNSTTTHKDAVEAVKTKWPKNNTGPVE